MKPYQTEVVSNVIAAATKTRAIQIPFGIWKTLTFSFYPTTPAGYNTAYLVLYDQNDRVLYKSAYKDINLVNPVQEFILHERIIHEGQYFQIEWTGITGADAIFISIHGTYEEI